LIRIEWVAAVTAGRIWVPEIDPQISCRFFGVDVHQVDLEGQVHARTSLADIGSLRTTVPVIRALHHFDSLDGMFRC
jgi:hypothetical protein